MTGNIDIEEVKDLKAFIRATPNSQLVLDSLGGMPGAPDGGRPWCTTAVALAAGRVVGVVRGHKVETSSIDSKSHSFGYDNLAARAIDTWFIEALAADRDWKDQGIEALLLDEAVSLARHAGASGLSTIIGSFAAELVRLFEAESFSIRGRATGTYSTGIGVEWLLLVRETVH